MRDKILCMLFGCNYAHNEHCKRCGEMKPNLKRAIQTADRDEEERIKTFSLDDGE